MTTTITYDELPTLVGQHLGFTDFHEVTQDQINLFADATGDQQWIHTDPERAKDGPFGATIAHGFLTLSLVIPAWTELLEVEGVTTKVNYGLDKVRFPAPVTVGSKVRYGATITELVDVPGGVQLLVDGIMEIEGGTKPAVVATSLYRFYK